jgi:hypothetical protein
VRAFALVVAKSNKKNQLFLKKKATVQNNMAHSHPKTSNHGFQRTTIAASFFAPQKKILFLGKNTEISFLGYHMVLLPDVLFFDV